MMEKLTNFLYFFFFNNNQKNYQGNNNSDNKGKFSLKTLSSYIDINKLYLIKKDWIKKYSLIIFSILAILFCASLCTIMFKAEVDLSVYYSTWSIIPSLCMVYLIGKSIKDFIDLSIDSMYLISNLGLLSLILASVIYIVANFLFFGFDTLSFSESFFFYSRKFLGGVLLALKLTLQMINLVLLHRKEPIQLYKAFFTILWGLIGLAFFLYSNICYIRCCTSYIRWYRFN